MSTNKSRCRAGPCLDRDGLGGLVTDVWGGLFAARNDHQLLQDTTQAATLRWRQAARVRQPIAHADSLTAYPGPT